MISVNIFYELSLGGCFHGEIQQNTEIYNANAYFRFSICFFANGRSSGRFIEELSRFKFSNLKHSSFKIKFQSGKF